MRGRSDPIPKYGGKPLPAIATLAVIMIMLTGGIGAFVWGYLDEGYEEVEKLASVKCLGCLGLDPRIDGFSEFWREYPDGHENEGEAVKHKPTVKNAFDDGDISVVILFFWGPGCVPCAEQWEEMSALNISGGNEKGGREGDAYPELGLYSIDATNDKEDLYWTYHFNGKKEYNGIPMTVFLFRIGDDIWWWSHYGKMDAKEVADMIENIPKIREHLKLSSEYHDISHA